MTPHPLHHTSLAQALRRLVLEQDFGALSPAFPSIDLAVAAFPAQGGPVCANVLFSRDRPDGVIATPAPGAGAIADIAYLADVTDAAGVSIAWNPATDWNTLDWRLLQAGPAPATRMVAPYPASLVKLMFAVGLALAVDTGACGWDSERAYEGRTRRLADWCEDMLTLSCNDAASAVVAALHACGMLDARGGALQRALHGWGLTTLRVEDTRADGGWRNADGCGVGHLQMTAWDSVRLLWLLDDAAPPAPWLAQDAPARPSPGSRAVLRAMLADQGLHTVLSSTALAGPPAWRAGIPARMASRWLTADGGAAVAPHDFPPGAQAASAAAEVAFAHKTGTTENYLADAGIVRGIAPARRHYLIALTSSLGQRHAPHRLCASTWKVPALGRAIDDTMQTWLEAN
jgi:hypothetical protein